jgi:mannose/fructose/N-acetylgalactosamine-specific phosphotransferase system component IID
LIKIIEKNISGKNVLGIFVLTNLVYAFMLMVTIPNTMAFSNGMKLLDIRPTGYDFDYVNKLFSTLGNTGREIYLNTQIPVDMIYPLLFGISYSAVMTYFLKKINKLNTPSCLMPKFCTLY